MKLNHRHYILTLFAFLSIAISILGYIFIYSRTTAQAENYLSATKEVSLENSKQLYEEKLIETFNLYETERAKIASYIVKDDQLVPFIERIEKIGPDTNTNLELSSINDLENKITAKVQISGTWSNVMRALILIENLPLSLLISNVRLDSSGEVEQVNGKTVTKMRGWKMSLDIEALTNK